MDKAAIVRLIGQCGVVAVVRADSPAEAVGATRALLKGGVRGIEITFTVPGAAEAIAEIAREAEKGNLDDEPLLGAGTVMSREQAREALEAGAQFLVSPCLVPEVIEAAKTAGVAMLPGALTPTEIWTAYQMGGDIIKVFPAARFGPAYFKDIKAPLPHIPLLPTGGVDAQNAGEWIAAGAVALGAGGKLVDKTAIKNGDWETLTVRARELMAAVRAARGE